MIEHSRRKYIDGTNVLGQWPGLRIKDIQYKPRTASPGSTETKETLLSILRNDHMVIFWSSLNITITSGNATRVTVLGQISCLDYLFLLAVCCVVRLWTKKKYTNIASDIFHHHVTAVCKKICDIILKNNIYIYIYIYLAISLCLIMCGNIGR